MNATSNNKIWTESLKGATLTYNCQRDPQQIVAKIGDKIIRFDYPAGITIADIFRIREKISKEFKIKINNSKINVQ